MICDAAVALVKRHEGLRLDAYYCQAGVCTIGYGHTGDVKPGDRITAHQAEVILRHDLDRFDVGVARLTPGLNANQHGALVSFAFNLGLAALERSGLLRVVRARPADFKSVRAELMKWKFARDPKTSTMVALAGLERRRSDEADLYEAPP